MAGIYSPDEMDNLHNEGQEDSLSYEDIYGETYEQTCANYSPWQAEQDAMEYEFNSRYDYQYEAYGHEARMMAQADALEAKYELYESRERHLDEMEANGGPRFHVFKWFERREYLSPVVEAFHILTDDIPF